MSPPKKVRRAPPAPPQATEPPTRHVLSERFADPDLVDRIFDYVVQLLPQFAERAGEVKDAVRDEFDGERAYIRADRRSVLGRRVLAEFNGRNASEVARLLGCSRATVYRLIKQPGKPMK